MRSMSDDRVESLPALAEVDLSASDWPRHPSPQERQAGSYSIATVEMAGVDQTENWHAFVEYVSWLRVVSSRQHPGARAEMPLLRSDTEVAALRGKIVVLEGEQDRLREQLQRLEGKLDEFLATPAEMETVPVDPHTRWIQENFETLRQYPDEWIALHPVRGILFHMADGDEFAGMLDGLSADEREEVLAFHSSMYI
jgi:hypothetical protein